MCEGGRLVPPVDHRFTLRDRLRRRNEIRAVFGTGARFPGRLLAIWVIQRANESRVVVVAGRRVGGAVVRNRAKRLLREAYRLNRHHIQGGYDLALVAQQGCGSASRGEVEAELLRLLGRGGCLGPGADRSCSAPRIEPK